MQAKLPLTRSTKTYAVVALGALAVTLWISIPRATAATKVDYFTGEVRCVGTLTVVAFNASSSPTNVTFIVRNASGGDVAPVAGDGKLSGLAPKNTGGFNYNCGSPSPAFLTIQVRTTTTGVLPSAHYTGLGGSTPIDQAAGAWVMRVRH